MCDLPHTYRLIHGLFCRAFISPSDCDASHSRCSPDHCKHIFVYRVCIGLSGRYPPSLSHLVG